MNSVHHVISESKSWKDCCERLKHMVFTLTQENARLKELLAKQSKMEPDSESESDEESFPDKEKRIEDEKNEAAMKEYEEYKRKQIEED